MLRDRSNNTSGGIFFDKEKIHISLFAFIETNLPDFPNYLKTLDVSLSNEDDITQQLFFFLDDKTRGGEYFPFKLGNQFKYINSKRSSDLGVIVQHFSKTNPFFVFEAKRLPTPGSGRQKEYVFGAKGGIERFKKGYHGKGLEFCGMIAYIQEEDADYWVENINSWINDLFINKIDSWNTSESLIHKKKLNNMYVFHSAHSRDVDDDFTLIHYWLNLQ